jgi:Rieske Fe-S protein
VDPKTDVTPQVSRRDVVRLGGVAVGVGAAAVGLVACGDDESGSNDAAKAAGTTAASPSDSSAATVITPLADVPVGSAVIAAAGDETIVVAQPEAGQIKGFSAKCTHQGCVVAVKSKTVLECPCHQSTFDALTGAVIQGVATEPLPSVKVVVQGENVVTA